MRKPAAAFRLLALVLTAAAAAMLAGASIVIAAAPAQPSLADAQADFAAGQYQPCLAKISRLLSSRSFNSDPTDRYELLMLRGECLLQQRQSLVAVAAFDAASEAIKGQEDLPRVARAKAMTVLIRASPGLKYRSRSSPTADELDIVAAEPRKAAMIAMTEDRIAELTPQVEKALKQTSLPPIQKLVPAVWEAYCLDLTASGATAGGAARTMPIVKSIGEHARGLIGSELRRLGARLDTLNDLAHEPTSGNGNRVVLTDSIGFRGLSSPERNELQEIAAYLTNIKTVCEEGRRINRRIGGSGEQWDALLAECAEACDTAQKAYDARY
jgi:hypothetical protein